MLDPFAEVREQYPELISRDDLAVATFAGGCFWCLEGPFEALEGVEEAILGYAGGAEENPTYDQVAHGETSHIEAVQVFYNPEKVSFSELLELYWWQIDPTDPGGQFADRGEQYATAVFYHNRKQHQEIQQQIQKLNDSERYDEPIATRILPYTTFYPAEDYHQQFYEKRAAYYQMYKKGSGRADYIAAMQKKYHVE